MSQTWTAKLAELEKIAYRRNDTEAKLMLEAALNRSGYALTEQYLAIRKFSSMMRMLEHGDGALR